MTIAYSVFYVSSHITQTNCRVHVFLYGIVREQSRVQYSLQELRPISTPQLHALLRFHLVPINLIISQGT